MQILIIDELNPPKQYASSLNKLSPLNWLGESEGSNSKVFFVSIILAEFEGPNE